MENNFLLSRAYCSYSSNPHGYLRPLGQSCISYECRLCGARDSLGKFRLINPTASVVTDEEYGILAGNQHSHCKER
jgi:hypothetical protein